MTTDLAHIGFGYILTWTIIFISVGWIAYIVYRAMDHPRLVLHATPEGPRARPRDVALYVISMPLLILAWYAFFLGILLLNNNELQVDQLVVFPAALIIAIRFLAFTATHAANELAKVVPIALIAGNTRSAESWLELIEKSEGVSVTTPAIIFVLFADYLFTAIWYWAWIRWGQPRWQERRSAQQVTHDDGGVAILTDADGADRRT